MTSKRIRYEDEPDRGLSERMQDPETIFLFLKSLIDKELEYWPDQFILADLPQIPEDQLDEPLILIVGRCSGPIRDTQNVEITTSEQNIIFKRPKETRFVRITLQDGTDIMERYDNSKHGEWKQIPDIGRTPFELLEQLYGFGDTEINQGQQFQRERKKPGGASKTYWKSGHNPTPEQKPKS